MGNAQSRQQQHGQQEQDHETSPSSPATQPSHQIAPSDHDADTSTTTSGGASRKRSRETANPATSESSNAAEQPLRQRRRIIDIAPHSSAYRSQPGAISDAMDIDAQAATNPSSSTPPAIVEPPSAAATLESAVTPTSSQQNNHVGQPEGGPAAAEVSNATPPPHLDALRDERERARRQILETLGSTPPALSGAVSSDSATVAAAGTQAPTPAASASTQTATAIPPTPVSSAAFAALLGAMAAGRAASDPSPAPGVAVGSSSPNPASAAPVSTSTSSTESQQQTPEQPARPQAVRVPLQPEMISGTSMVVQGALVARTIPNPPSSEAGTANSTASGQAPEQQPAPSESQPHPTVTESDAASARHARAHIRPGLLGPSPEGDPQRGAVTLEEQAVMLSRILSIAAAATAASLLNTSESHHVDPSLLQTSLRRPFERLNQQQNSDRSEPWLADWQTSNGRNNRASTNSDGGGSRLPNSTASSSSLGNGLRGRLAALSRRVQSASSSSGLPSADRPERSNDVASTAPAAQGQTENVGAANNPTSNATAADRAVIVDALLRAAERERDNLENIRRSQPGARAETSLRGRVVSASSVQSDSSSAQQSSPRSGLSRLVRSTLDNFLHPTRLLSTRSSRSEGDQSQDSAPLRDGWTQGTTSSSSSIPSDAATSGFSLGPNDVAGTLRQVRNGVLPDGVPGSFGSFLNHLVRDLMAAVQLMRPSSEAAVESNEARSTNYFENATPRQTTSGAEVLDGDASDPAAQSSTTPAGSPRRSEQQQPPPATNADAEDLETQARRNRDFQSGNLSFFRLFRFDPVAPSQLVPCIVVGVRSLEVTERFGEDMVGVRPAGPGREFGVARQQTSRPTTLGSARPTATLGRQRSQSEGPQTAPAAEGASGQAGGEEQPASRFMLFVSGGRYPPNHPLLTSNPATAGRDLMILMDLLSTMQAMQNKPSTVTQQEIDASELRKVKGSEVAEMVRAGLITENMAERCLVCLEDWKDDDDVRMLACKHGFHALCVDRWMTNSSNTCPMCRRQGVSKDGRRAGEETADSQRAAQAQP